MCLWATPVVGMQTESVCILGVLGPPLTIYLQPSIFTFRAAIQNTGKTVPCFISQKNRPWHLGGSEAEVSSILNSNDSICCQKGRRGPIV